MQQLGGVVVEATQHEVRRGRRFVVTRATLARDGRPVAVKSVRPDQRSAANDAALRHEYAMLEKCLDLAGVERLIGWRHGRGSPAVVVEDAGPSTLVDRPGGPLRTEAFVDLAIDLAEALERIHERGVIHRDIQPSNIALSAQGHALAGSGRTGGPPTLIDFDQATLSASVASDPVEQPAGALPYLSPELIGRMNRKVDVRSDLYSLGAVFYELLTGSPPFRSADPLELVHAHLTRAPLPPRVLAAGVPELVSSIVVKLLAKTPEERYQSAAALAFDLRELRARRSVVAGSRSVEPFELGRFGLALELPFPDQLFGREAQVEALRAATERVSVGPSELVIVQGEAGAGKSTLVANVRERILALGGRFISGKCDPRTVHAPHSSLIEALRALVADLQAAPEAARAEARARILEAVGGNGRVLIDLVPELETLIGLQPVLAELDPVQMRTRLSVTLQAFLQALAAEHSPLALFLDDLHWADAATADVLTTLAADPESRSILLLGAVRFREASADAPVVARLEASLRRVSRGMTRVDVGPLRIEAIAAFLAAALRASASDVRRLAELVARKTAGNPFFIRQLVRSLQKQGLLARDASGHWSWDVARIEQAEITENVVDLLVGAIRRLPVDTREVLTLAACLGGRLDLPIVSMLTNRSGDRARAVLRPALDEGLVVPDQANDPSGGSFHFAHDRIQQAAYSMLDERQRMEAHLRIARRLMEAPPGDGGVTVDPTFVVADQFNSGVALLETTDDRLALARLDYQAALKAKASAAFGPALGYLNAGLAALPERPWDVDRELAMTLHREAAECACVTADFALADRLVDQGLEHAKTAVERSNLYGVSVLSASLRGAWREAIGRGREGLRELGFPLPAPEETARATIVETLAVDALMAGRSPSILAELPLMEAPADQAMLRLLADLGVPAWFQEPALVRLLCLRGQRFLLERGNAPASANLYATLALCHAGDNRFDLADAFSRVALDVADRFGQPAQRVHAMYMRTISVLAWLHPHATVLAELERLADRAKDVGETRVATYAIATRAAYSIIAGRELDGVLRQIDDAQTFLRKTRNDGMMGYLLTERQIVRCLKGLTAGRNRFDDDDFDEAAYMRAIEQVPPAACKHHQQRAFTSLVFRDFPLALAHAQAAERHVDSLAGHLVMLPLYAALCAAAMVDQAPQERATWLAKIAVNRRQLVVWEETCAENFRHRRLLVDAEVARLEGRHAEAADLYDQAIEAASAQGVTSSAALASELAGRHMLALGRTRLSQFRLREAKALYAQWGATEKARALEEEFPELDRAEVTTPVGRGFDAELDIRSLLQATETLSTEVRFDRLVEKLIGICVQAAGAQRVAVIVEDEGMPLVRASGRGGVQPVDLESTPLSLATSLARGAIELVRASRRALIIDDASRDTRVSADPYVASRAMKSILVTPVQRQGTLVATLYFENDQATHAFTAGRLRVLELLSSEIAITLENSILFEKLRAEIAERTRAEASVRFLANAGVQLSATLDDDVIHEKLAQVIVPSLADWCLVDVVDDATHGRRLAGAHVDPEKAALLRREIERDAESARLVASLGGRSVLTAPMVAHGRTLGTITCVRSTSGAYGPADQTILAELAYRGALAIDNARLFQRATSAVQLREDFLSVASHELRTPLASLMLSVQALESGLVPTTPQSMGSVMGLIGRQSRRLSRLVDDLMDVSQIEANRIVIKRETVDLSALVREVVDGFGGESARAGSPVSVTIPDEIVGAWDRSRLAQVVSNLLSNAIKFGAGAPIEVSLDRRDGEVRLAVRDHGVGIDPGRMPFIFERFERGVSAQEYGGLGLGLYIVRSIVERLGGSVSCVSEPRSGSTFTVLLPMALDAM
jgi:predicted ATPase/signal transduction histidine kinase